jgi:SAM-dependent methyltransferase
MPEGSEFDDYADTYDLALAQGLSLSGEGRDYFAQGRIAFLGRCLREARFAPLKAMDFGCGTGDSVPLIRSLVGSQTIVGIDESSRSIQRASINYGAPGVTFALSEGYVSPGDFDLAYTNGVFHHIPPAERPTAVAFLHDVLRPGGILSLWENNPWSLGARYVMSKIPFDRDAIMLSAAGARKLLRENGFRVLRTDYRFIFPKALRILRSLEELLRRTPAGAQYQVLCTKI